MTQIYQALHNLNRNMRDQRQAGPQPFKEFLKEMSRDPLRTIRNVFQVFHDMISSHVRGGFDEYVGDPESIHYLYWDLSRLFVENSDNPFFADRLFANRFMRMVDTMRRGTQQNKIYIFEGPHGSGKSTFLNNLLLKFEEYANTPEGVRFETVWRLDRRLLDTTLKPETLESVERLLELLESPEADKAELLQAHSALQAQEDFVEIPCPCHDHPLLQIPKDYRRNFLDDLFRNDEIKWRLFTEKEYEWLFSATPCTICSSIYQALLAKLKSPERVLDMLYVRPYHFNRRLGEGISVFNPGDMPLKQTTLTNEVLQKRIDNLLQDSNRVRYLYSQFAKTNNGIFALMDIKGHNRDRLLQLHNILSDGVHKVEEVEEHIESLFIALINPEDKARLEEFQSMSDRVETVTIPYILDLNTEVQIYRNVFGKQIDAYFLPRVLHNFARVIISSRLTLNSPAMLEWIHDPARYRRYCDEHLQLLKMEIYTGHIPTWLEEEDRQRLTAKRRRRIIGESVIDGRQGFSGRDSITLFNDFFSTSAQENTLINMESVRSYFTKTRKDLLEAIPQGFFDALQQMYDYSILQDIKECLYYYNEDQIRRELQNYLFAVNFDPGTTQTCRYTGDRLSISEDFFNDIELKLLGSRADAAQREHFRQDVQKSFASRALTQEMMVDGKPLLETGLYRSLHERYVHNLKDRVLEPFLKNENFRRAIKDFNKSAFKSYDRKIRDDVAFLIDNLCRRFGYVPQGAQEVCIYIIDHNLAHKYSGS